MTEQLYRRSRKGKLLRPFSEAASVKCRSYSRPLQRAMTDFGADHSFAQVPKKLKEHYLIDVPVSSSRLLTQHHAQAMLLGRDFVTKMPGAGVCELIGEVDGTNVPIVETPEKQEKSSVKDRRKLRKVGWREARLCLVRRPESVTALYRATMGGVDETGKELLDCFIEAGGGSKTRLHCVGDAAPWIINQVEKRFPKQATYLIDYFHLSEYLSAAADEMIKDGKQEWLTTQQDKMKENRVREVVETLREAVAGCKDEARDNAVRACERYLSNHERYFDYKTALEKGLPIGSGEVEGGHRWIIQKRLKLSGAWWKEANAAKMLALRVVRANDEWQS